MNIVSHYKEFKLQSIKSRKELYPQVRGKSKNQPIVLSTIDDKEKTFNLVV
jgi:hypothetical protein